MKPNFPKILFILFSLLLFSCDSKRWEVGNDAEQIEISIERFEKDLFKGQPYEFNEAASNELIGKYPDFLPLFAEGIMNFGKFGSSQYFIQTGKFIQDENIRQLYTDVIEKYNEVTFLEKELSDAFTRYHYFFPERIVPKINTFISAFAFSLVTDDSLLGIGLDNYLGGDYEFYPKAGIPKYQFSHFEKQFMASDAMNAWLTTEFIDYEGSSLLEQMVHSGKVLYITQAFLPEKGENIILRYSEDELEWCEDNETEIWFHFVDHGILYSNDNNTIRKYMGAAPFVAGFPEGSPGRVGHWLGLQIVKHFMEKKENISLAQLLEKDANEILTDSRYKPKRK